VRYLFVLLFLVWPWIGAGVETLVFLEEPSAAKAVDMIRTGALDLYGAGVTEPTILQQIQSEPNLGCSSTYNAVWHLSFNPIGPTFTDGRLNPFFDPRAREAINWLVDRDYIVQEILGGAGFPQVLPLRPLFPDYARLAQYARPLELRYQYDPERARNVLSEVLFSLGAEFVDGKWTYQGKPIELRILIRTDSRRPLGDYLAGLLEGLGFTVTRIYASYAEALRILSSPPEEGLWHIYTNSLVVSLIERDEASTFQLNYTPAFPYPPWEYLRPNPELADLADRLAHGLYSSLEEREALMARALELAMKDSSQVWLAVRAACYPHASDLNFAVDLAAGLATGIWAHTLSSPKETIRIAVPSLLAAPLNPVAGSFTVYDQMIIRATADPALIPHPYSGLYLPVDLVRAEVEAEEGSPIQKSLDWVELRFVPEITVPKEAWLDWDAKAIRFLTVGEVKPQGLKAKARVILHFRPDLWEKTWHDGSPFSLGDFLVRLILLFDRAKPESSVYDESGIL
jgi:Predicted solute binding protein